MSIVSTSFSVDLQITATPAYWDPMADQIIFHLSRDHHLLVS